MDASTIFLSLFGLVREPVRFASIMLNDAVIGAAIAILLVLVLSWRFGEQRSLPFLACAIVVALLLGFSFKAFLQEPRPCIAAPGKISCPQDFSLPSLHALLAFTLAIVFLGERSFPIYFLFALFVAFSRVYLGVHTGMQVAAGLALAFFACVLAEIIFKRQKWALPRTLHIRHDINRIRA